MRPILLSAAFAAALSVWAGPQVRFALDPAAPGHAVPRTLYGIFFEDINHAADGGVYPELLENRGFDWKTKELEGWTPDFRDGAMARISLQDGNPVHPNTARHLRIECFGAGTGCGVRNHGFGGVAVEAGKSYDLAFYARGLAGYRGGLRCVLEDGGRVVCEARLANAEMSVGRAGGLDPELPAWKRHAFVFTPAETVRQGTFSVLLDAPGAVELEQVSLFPRDTFNGRPNGLRKDLVQLLKDLKPGLLRFPGGCVAEGHDFQHWFDWKRTVGPLERRETIWNTWGYWQSMGLGFYEYFCLAEDIGAEPLPICLAGMTCQFRGVKLAPPESMDYFARNICDLVDFANGDPSANAWAKLRADMGHPAPFGLKYVGIGNENWGREFLDRYLDIAARVRAVHPEIQIVSSVGAAPSGRDFDLAWRTLTDRNADFADEHYYISPQRMLDFADRYDGYARRGKPAVYAGEYACHVPGKANNLRSALCEAALMTGFERNSDIVRMSSYAPLFNKVGWNGWKPDLIWFDNLGAFGTPNYYVQKMFANNLPTRYCPARVEGAAASTPEIRGGIGLQAWNTAAEFKDIRVTGRDGKVLFAGLPDLKSAGRGREGRWSVADGVLRQSNEAATQGGLLSFGAPGWKDYTLAFKARRVGGREGFIARFCMAGGEWLSANIGGWENTRSAMEAAGYEITGKAESDFTVETGRWYDVVVSIRDGRVTTTVDGRALWRDVGVRLRPRKRFHGVCGFDEAAGEYVLKCVNLDEKEPADLAVDFGAVLPAGRVKVQRLAGDPAAENDLAHPTRCATVVSEEAFAGGRVFRTALPPASLTVFRVRK